MKLDANGLVLMEQDKDFRGSVGDSCAETARLVTLQCLLNMPVKSRCELFLTANGTVRYPGNPPPWPASDTSDDQVCPLLAALSLQEPLAAKALMNQLKRANWETGNGELIHLTTYAQLKRAQGSRMQWLWDLSLVMQAIILAMPFAWNPSASLLSPRSWFISSKGQSANYLNFINALAFARQCHWTVSCWLATKLCKQETAQKEVASYYKPEPNANWLLQLYARALPKIWGRL